MFSSTSGRSILGFRIEPRSPPVQVATITSTPSATYLAVLAAPLLDSSSGWAWTCRSRKRSPAASNRSGGRSMGAHAATDLVVSPTTAVSGETDGGPNRHRNRRIGVYRTTRHNGRHAYDPERLRCSPGAERRRSGATGPPLSRAAPAAAGADRDRRRGRCGVAELADLDGPRARRAGRLGQGGRVHGRL